MNCLKPGYIPPYHEDDRCKVPYRDVCGKCGARRIDAQLGLEPTPEAFVAGMVRVFAEVRRVLRPDGTCWVNLGDSYNAARNGGHPGGENGFQSVDERYQTRSGANAPGLKPKDLVGIPWRVAFALQADGWYLRSDIIWAKANPMPESVTDRPTKSHEYLFLLTKRERYYYDAEAVREAGEGYGKSERFRGHNWTNNRAFNNNQDRVRQGGGSNSFDGSGRNARSVWTIPDPIMKLRSDLTPEKRAYVISELSKRGVL